MAKLKVIDVSEHQGIIDWKTAKQYIDGAILRCGYGDNILSQDDGQWARNISECERLGIPRGVYLYSYATNDAMAQSELQHILRCLKGHTYQLPIYLDVEQAGTEGYAARACQIICEGLKAAGYKAGVYANTNWWNNYLTGVTAYTRWVAQYNSVCTYSGKHDIWQYTSGGSVPGIKGRVDMNWCYVEFDKLSGSENGNQSKPNNPAPQQKPTSKPEIIYAVKTRNHGILPDVKGRSDFAGTANDSIVGIKIGVTSGRVEYRVFCGGRWLPKVSGANWNDAVNGYAGDDVHSIEAIQCYYYTDASKTGGKYYSVVYQVKPYNKNSYYPNVTDTNWESRDGNRTAGAFGVPFTQLLMSLE